MRGGKFTPNGCLFDSNQRLPSPCPPPVSHTLPPPPPFPQLALEEDLGNRVLQAKAELFKALWQQAQLISSTVLALVADARTNYVGQMQRLEQLAEKDGDEGAWHKVARKPAGL